MTSSGQTQSQGHEHAWCMCVLIYFGTPGHYSQKVTCTFPHFIPKPAFYWPKVRGLYMLRKDRKTCCVIWTELLDQGKIMYSVLCLEYLTSDFNSGLCDFTWLSFSFHWKSQQSSDPFGDVASSGLPASSRWGVVRRGRGAKANVRLLSQQCTSSERNVGSWVLVGLPPLGNPQGISSFTSVHPYFWSPCGAQVPFGGSSVLCLSLTPQFP